MVETFLTLVRHGESIWNAHGILQGQADCPLSETGRQQAALVAARLAQWRFDACYTSDLARARETAKAVTAACGLPALPHPGLRERAMGRWEGLSLEQVGERYPEDLAAWLADRSANQHGGERLEQMVKRVLAAVQEILDRHPGGRLLAITHGGPIKAVVCSALGIPAEFANRFWIGNTSITEVKRDAKGLVVRGVNDLCHLGPPCQAERIESGG